MVLCDCRPLWKYPVMSECKYPFQGQPGTSSDIENISLIDCANNKKPNGFKVNHSDGHCTHITQCRYEGRCGKSHRVPPNITLCGYTHALHTKIHSNHSI